MGRHKQKKNNPDVRKGWVLALRKGEKEFLAGDSVIFEKSLAVGIVRAFNNVCGQRFGRNNDAVVLPVEARPSVNNSWVVTLTRGDK